uniref:Baculoviral IAP repeat-containing protein n=1 Tax=Melicertus latisulcatus majanivirus TaxID=2984277 RepID=A0A9C7EYF6_9VIRU|nr:MAG: baculoviral IAP repeat-containing protein [Melicertus latisulcatus majanivirus]
MEDKESNCNIYQHEDERSDSFNHYYYIDPRLLAKAGFFSSKSDDIQCFTCDLEIDMKTLTSTDDIIKIHKERSPKCSFAQSLYGFENILKFLKLPIRKTYEHIHENLNQEKVRLSTFIDWPLEWLSPSSLAADGFYYTRREDRVKCVFCRKEISGFKKGCIIGREEHKRLSPNCRFVNGSSTLNIPIKFYCIEGMLWHNIRKHQPSLSSSYPYSASIHDSSWRDKFSTTKERLESFENWPDGLVQKPLDLANAGFFYEGANDYVRCFHCYGGLYNWEKGDIPWNEHAKWYPKCQHIKSKRGIEFIHNIEEEMKRKPAMDPDDILMELDIVKCVVSMGYSIYIAKKTLKKHVKFYNWPYLRIEEYINDMNQLMETYPKIMKPEPPSIINHIISETKDAYIQSLRSKIEDLSKT